MTFIHERAAGFQDFARDDTTAPNPQINLMLSAPGANYTLYRTRLGFEARITAYSQSDSQNPPDFWWKGITGFVGLWYTSGATDPPQSLAPYSGGNSPGWVIWDFMVGEMESIITTAAGYRRYTRLWRPSEGTIESFARRSPHGAATQSVWLSYQFIDPDSIIDSTHITYDLVYDLDFGYAADIFWKPA